MLKNQELARKYGVAVAERLFKEMQKPENQGANWVMTSLPNMAYRDAYYSVFMYFSDSDFKEIFRAIAGEAAEVRANQLLRGE